MNYYNKFPTYRQWPLDRRRIHLPKIPLLGHNTPVVNLGSCFGETLQLFLDMYHFNIIEPQAGYKYSCQSIMREVSWAYTGRTTTEAMLYQGEKGYTDFNHHRIFDTDKVSYLAKINAIERNVRTALSSAEVVILTPSLTEVWKNRKTDEYILHPYPGVMRDAGEFQVEFLTTADNVVHLRQIRDILLGFNPDMKIIANLCPTPLRVTHSGNDVILANNASKAILHAAIQEFCSENDNTYYFPGFDIVAQELSERKHYTEDNRHLTHSSLKYYMQRFSSMFCTDESVEIMTVLERMHTASANKQEELIQRLKDLNYDRNLLLVKQANIFLAKGMNRQAFDTLCEVSLLAKSPAVQLNLGLILLAMGVHQKARYFLSNALELLQEIPAIAFEMADRNSRVRFGDSHMYPQRNISVQRAATLTAMRDLIVRLLENFPATPASGLRKLVFCDTLSHNLFPFDFNKSKLSAA